jgi:two-component system sensor histidine kinase QseC
VDCRLQREEGGYTLSIENDAPGLMGEDLLRFGARFWRKHVEGGTAQHAGLGLALCLALSRSLGVRLEFGLHEGRLQACLGRFDAL